MKDIILGSIEDEMAEIEDAIRMLAEMSTHDETPGTHPDPLMDALIMLCRRIVSERYQNK